MDANSNNTVTPAVRDFLRKIGSKGGKKSAQHPNRRELNRLAAEKRWATERTVKREAAEIAERLQQYGIEELSEEQCQEALRDLLKKPRTMAGSTPRFIEETTLTKEQISAQMRELG